MTKQCINVYSIKPLSEGLDFVKELPEHKPFLDFQKKAYELYGHCLDKLNPPTFFWKWNKEVGRKIYFNTDTHSYYYHYANYLNNRRLSAKKVLEIGVYQGHSMLLWNDYFPNAEIVGVDIDLNQEWLGDTPVDICKNKERITLIEADGTDKKVANDIGKKYGKFDIIVDDGSHHPTHQILSLLYFLPYLKKDGIYIVEDIIIKEQKNYLENYKEGSDVGLFEEFLDEFKTNQFWIEDVDLTKYGINTKPNQDILKTIDKIEVKIPPRHRIGKLDLTIKSSHRLAFITKK
jgi:cephalosporin hydroxylase